MGRQPGAAPPPSEQPRALPGPERRGVGVFRLAGWGWGVTIALAILVGIVVVVGLLRDDPARNPAPAAYRAAVCTAVGELRAGTASLARGVEGREDPAVRSAAAAQVEGHVAATDRALADLPEWVPGRSLDELIGSQIITLTNGAAALEDGPVEEDLATALSTDARIREQLSDRRYGFSCDA